MYVSSNDEKSEHVLSRNVNLPRVLLIFLLGVYCNGRIFPMPIPLDSNPHSSCHEAVESSDMLLNRVRSQPVSVSVHLILVRSEMELGTDLSTAGL